MKQLFNGNAAAFNQSVDVSDLSSGIYLLNYFVNDKPAKRAFVIGQ